MSRNIPHPTKSTNEMNISLAIMEVNFTIPPGACVGMYDKPTHTYHREGWCESVTIFIMETRGVKMCYLQHEDSWRQSVAFYSMETRAVKVCYLQHGGSCCKSVAIKETRGCKGVAIYSMKTRGVKV